uniref:Uncharacterized protein n=1 Tax=viral metagenome TaxID=1070528 RepID=A0A6C0F9Q8_9ZZZZ|tara:strand:+ start:247 stop:819 length:573 start_codon:yes stop_codon:yes gene_type:complete
MPWTEEEQYYIQQIPNFDMLKNGNYVNKRVQNELISIQKCIDYDTKVDRGIEFKNIEPIFIEFLINDKNKVTFSFLFKYKYTIRFQLIFKPEYPFKPPDCNLLNNGDYKILLARISEHYYKTDNSSKKTDVSEEKCLCCSTVLCRNNWYPGMKISSLLEEINTNTTYMYDIVYKMLENKIYDKYLGYQLL